jgi:hypothetical protein
LEETRNLWWGNTIRNDQLKYQEGDWKMSLKERDVEIDCEDGSLIELAQDCV